MAHALQLPKIKYGMDPNFLKIWELDYEIKIRNCESKGDSDQKRKILRGLLSQELGDRSFSGIIECYEYKVDREEILHSLEEITVLVGNYEGDTTDVSYRRIVSRLYHVSSRISRIKTLTDAEQKGQKELRFKLIEIEGDFDQKNKPATSTPHSPNHESLQTFFNTSKVILPYKWNLYFTGNKSKDSVLAFLEKVESMRISRGVSKDDLFKCAGDLFKSQAWTWYNNNRSRFNNWDQLVNKLKEDFLPYNYDENLLDEIRNRTVNEKVLMYITNMEALFNRLSEKPSEQTIINKIRRNLLPNYVSHLALLDISSIDELINKCKKIEESLTWSNKYKPPTKGINYLEPDLSCPNFYDSQKNFGFNDKSFMGNTLNKSKFFSTNQISVQKTYKCWNCNGEGHSFRECRKPKQLFCFLCGLKGVSKNTCPKCNKVRNPEIQMNMINTPSTSRDNTGSFHRDNTDNDISKSNFLEFRESDKPPIISKNKVSQDTAKTKKGKEGKFF